MPIHAGLVATWPHPAEALRLIPVLVLVLVQMLWAWSGAAQPVTTVDRSTFLELHGSPLVAALIVLACTPGGRPFMQRTRSPVARALEPYRRSPVYFIVKTNALAIDGAECLARIAAMAAALPKVVRSTDCVHTVFPAMTCLQGGKHTRARALTLYDADGHHSPQSSTEFRFFMALKLRSLQSGVTPSLSMAALRDQARAVLGSCFEHRDRRAVAVALIERTELLAADTGR